MKVAPKKPIRLRNRTKFFDPDKDKAFVHFASSDSYQSRRIKIEGYESRLYWQFRYCHAIGGQTFYYTLTYADKNLPVKYGTPCFDYEDLRDLFTGGFRKQLLRKYGTTFKYFVGAELGEGAGKRGFRNNPHYHILFFLEPNPIKIKRRIVEKLPLGVYKRNTKNHKKGDVMFGNVSRYEEIEVPYRLITPEEFRHLVRLYWQGFDEDTDGFRDFRTETKYGIAQEGDYLGLVKDFRAVSYVAKYCAKDVRLKMKEVDIRKVVGLRLREQLRSDLEFHKRFFHSVVYEKFNIPLGRDVWKYDDNHLMLMLLPYLKKFFDGIPDINPLECFTDETFVSDVKQICYRHRLWPLYNKFLSEYIDEKVKLALDEWRNRYSNKARISQGVGLYSLEFIDDLKNPSISVPSNNGFINRPLPLYLYRKLYTDIYKPSEISMTGKELQYDPVRILNQEGIDLKVSRLVEQISKLAEKSRNNLQFVLDNKNLFYYMRSSDVNVDVFYSYEELVSRVSELSNDNIDFYERYAIYKLVYEDRFFKISDSGSSVEFSFPVIDYIADYRRFLVPSALSVPRSDLRLDAFLDDDFKDYLSYSEHPFFLRYIGIFAVLDLCADYFFIQKDNKLQDEAEKREKVRKFHIKRNLNEKFNLFSDFFGL